MLPCFRLAAKQTSAIFTSCLTDNNSMGASRTEFSEEFDLKFSGPT